MRRSGADAQATYENVEYALKESMGMVGDDVIGDESAVETPEELLARLEREKQEWQEQLAVMKATLEAQDKKIEEDRSKCREVLEQEEQKAQLVPVNKAPTRKVIHVPSNGQSPQAKVPIISERARSVWVGSQEFHNRRARSVAKSIPFTNIGGLYLQTYGVTPRRYMGRSGNSVTLPNGCPAALANQSCTVDDMGRLVRPAKILSVTDSTGAVLPTTPSTTPGNSMTLPVAPSALTSPSTSSVPGIALSSGNCIAMSGGRASMVAGNTPGMRPSQMIIPAMVNASTTTLPPSASHNVIATTSSMAVPAVGASPGFQYRLA